MPADRDTIEKVIKSAHSDVDKFLARHNVRVRATQFLLPDTHQLNEIQRFLYCDKGTRQSYIKAQNIFVYDREEAGEGRDVLRSLYYLEFPEPYRYSCYGEIIPTTHEPIFCEISQEQFDNRKNPPIPITREQRRRLEDYNNLKPFWDGWCDTLRNVGYGYSTLWTYVRLRKPDGDFALASGIMVFDGCLGVPKSIEDENFKYLSSVSKRIQEALYELTLNLFKLEITRQATRAAISQIMARNMSHNVGSHVSYKATNLAIKSRIAKLYSHKFPDYETDPDKELKNLNRQEFIIDWIDFMSEKLDKYEIHRNEYLADFNLSPQSFSFYQDVVLPFCENTLILDNLASAEGACYTTPGDDNKLKIRVFIKPEGEECYTEIRAEYPSLTCDFPEDVCEEQIVYPDHFPYLLRGRSDQNSIAAGVSADSIAAGVNSKRPTGAADVDVLLHSEQGLYSILENFIRNSAKHNKDALATSPLEVRLYLEEYGDRFKLILCDSVSNLEAAKLFNNAPDNPGLYQRIKNSLVGDVEQSIRHDLGFADMKINSFLFKYRATEIGNGNISSNLHLVRAGGGLCTLTTEKIEAAFDDDDSSRKYSFGYQMELLKPRKVLWIGEDIRVGGGGRISDLKREGVFQYDDLTAYLKDCREGVEEIAAFEFVVFFKRFDYSEYFKNQIMLPPRVLVAQGIKAVECNKPNLRQVDASFEDISSVHDLLETCWELWLGRLPKRVAAYVYFENNDKAAAELDEVKNLKGGHTIESVNNLAGNVLVQDDETSVVYDHHGWAFRSRGPNKYKLDGTNTNFYTQHFKIVFDKGSDDYARLNQLPADINKRRLLAYQLIDAATTNVFILDERIAIQAGTNRANVNDPQVGIRFGTYDSLTFSRYCYGKVFALNHISPQVGEAKHIHSGECKYRLSLDISADSIHVSADDTANKILGEIDAINKDVLVIHRTYMKEEFLGMGIRDFLDLAEDTFGTVIVTSGGGYPHSIREEVRFLPFSIIQQCLGSRLAKLKLVSFLQKLRYVG